MSRLLAGFGPIDLRIKRVGRTSTRKATRNLRPRWGASCREMKNLTAANRKLRTTRTSWARSFAAV